MIGSPYAVRRYVADPAFGGPGGLAAARAALAARGVRLVLDYVPNHVAPDHPWVTGGQTCSCTATRATWPPTRRAGWPLVARCWRTAGTRTSRRGPTWCSSTRSCPALRAAAADTLASIAEQCDGIRCDMAMLMTSQVFARTWGRHAGPAPGQEFWPEVLGILRGRHPGTVLIAEAYWDLEWLLQQQGFDFCYDKRLYDRITGGDTAGVRDHLRAGLSYQSRLLRFLENHDEPRIASVLPVAAERAAAVTVATLPGGTLWHEGQFEGRRVRLPVFLARRPTEPPDARLAGWYRRPAGVGGGPPGARRGMAAARSQRLAGQPVLPQPDRLGLGRRSGRRPAPGRGQPVRAARPGAAPAETGLTWPAGAGSWPACSVRRCTGGTAASWPGPGCTSTWGRGSSTCSRCAEPVACAERVAAGYRMPAAVTTASAKVTTAPSPCTTGMRPAG